jgi:hypothetical protein
LTRPERRSPRCGDPLSLAYAFKNDKRIGGNDAGAAGTKVIRDANIKLDA